MDDAVAYLLKLTFVSIPIGLFLLGMIRVLSTVFANQANWLSYPFF